MCICPIASRPAAIHAPPATPSTRKRSESGVYLLDVFVDNVIIKKYLNGKASGDYG